jgi:hypothetical protein
MADLAYLLVIAAGFAAVVLTVLSLGRTVRK